MKKIIIVMTILLSAGYFIFSGYINAPTQIYPYPFLMHKYQGNNIQAAQQSDILIIGDRMGKALTPYLKDLTTDISNGLQNDIKIYNWSEDYEGMHRTLEKVRSLKTLPKLIFYHGASTEFYERTINPKDYSKIKYNFDLIENDIILSIIMVLPWLSKFIYKPYKHLFLKKNITKDTSKKLSDINNQKLLEISFKVFNYKTMELIQEIIDRDSIILFITTPLNYEIPPKGACEYSQTKEDIDILKKISTMHEKEDFKSANELSDQLLKIYPTNPFANYYKSLSTMKLGQKTLSLRYAALTSVFDCSKWRGNAVYNSIIKTNIKNYDLHQIEFYELINHYLGTNTLFLDDLFPQNIYYQEMMGLLKDKIIELLRLRKS